MKLRILFIITGICFVLLGSSTAFAYSTSGYILVKEMRVWDSRIDVYLESAESHKCGGSSYQRRFVLKPDEKRHFRALVAALFSGKQVQLYYSCDSSALPWINAVLIK